MNAAAPVVLYLCGNFIRDCSSTCLSPSTIISNGMRLANPKSIICCLVKWDWGIVCVPSSILFRLSSNSLVSGLDRRYFFDECNEMLPQHLQSRIVHDLGVDPLFPVQKCFHTKPTTTLRPTDNNCEDAFSAFVSQSKFQLESIRSPGLGMCSIIAEWEGDLWNTASFFHPWYDRAALPIWFLPLGRLSGPVTRLLNINRMNLPVKNTLLDHVMLHLYQGNDSKTSSP